MRKTSWIAAILCVAAPIAAVADDFSFKRVKVGDSLPGKRITVHLTGSEVLIYDTKALDALAASDDGIKRLLWPHRKETERAGSLTIR